MEERLELICLIMVVIDAVLESNKAFRRMGFTTFDMCCLGSCT